VLNLFSYTGPFPCARRRRAQRSSCGGHRGKAHARARRNYELSGLDPARMEQVTGEASKILERFLSRNRRFDIVICDPPTLPRPGPGRTFWRSRPG